MGENFVEQAERLAESEVRAGIARARTKEAMPSGFDGDCACGDAIPPERVGLGYHRCIRCQTLLERRGFGRAR